MPSASFDGNDLVPEAADALGFSGLHLEDVGEFSWSARDAVLARNILGCLAH